MVSLAVNIAAFLFLAFVGIIAFCLGIGIIVAFFRGVGAVAGSIVTKLTKYWEASSTIKKLIIIACLVAIPAACTITYQAQLVAQK